MKQICENDNCGNPAAKIVINNNNYLKICNNCYYLKYKD